MFNRAGFNRMPFNRSSFTSRIFGSFILEASGELEIKANMVLQPSFDLEAAGELVFDSIREQFASFVLESIGELKFEGTRERYGSFDLQAVGELIFAAGRFHLDYIEFEGDFEPGDRIIIDSNTLKMTINGQNALHLMNGDFFDLNIGENELIYTDDQGSRTVLMRVTYRDKFV